MKTVLPATLLAILLVGPGPARAQGPPVTAENAPAILRTMTLTEDEVRPLFRSAERQHVAYTRPGDCQTPAMPDGRPRFDGQWKKDKDGRPDLGYRPRVADPVKAGNFDWNPSYSSVKTHLRYAAPKKDTEAARCVQIIVTGSLADPGTPPADTTQVERWKRAGGGGEVIEDFKWGLDVNSASIVCGSPRGRKASQRPGRPRRGGRGRT